MYPACHCFQCNYPDIHQRSLVRFSFGPLTSPGPTYMHAISRNRQESCVGVQGMQMVVLALIRSIPPIASVAMFGLFEFIVFAIIGVQLFSGRLGACNQVVSCYCWSCWQTHLLVDFPGASICCQLWLAVAALCLRVTSLTSGRTVKPVTAS